MVKKNITCKTYTLEQVSDLVKDVLVPLSREYSIFTFEGPLGAGKTTLIREFLRQSGIKDVVTSPTFSYVNIYQLGSEKTFYHFDLYRLENVQEFIDAGFDEYVQEAGSCSAIEWPTVIDSLIKQEPLSKKCCLINISYKENNINVREIEIAVLS